MIERGTFTDKSSNYASDIISQFCRNVEYGGIDENPVPLILKMTHELFSCFHETEHSLYKWYSILGQKQLKDVLATMQTFQEKQFASSQNLYQLVQDMAEK